MNVKISQWKAKNWEKGVKNSDILIFEKILVYEKTHEVADSKI